MRDFISRKINYIFKDFKKNLEEIGTFCELKDLRFDSNHTPDYDKIIIQRLYLLRYFPAYLVEYYLMFQDMFKKKFLGKDLNIISIGAGCGIDYWGCKFASDELVEKINIRYTGMDIIDWKYWDSLGNEECYFLERDINQMDALDEEEYNVIVFPKSIGELSNETFTNLLKVLENTDFACDRIMLLSSVRTTRDFIDVNRLADIVTMFEKEQGYHCLDYKHQYTYYLQNAEGRHCKLEDICPKFTYPLAIRDYISNLNCKCAGFEENWNSPHYEDCACLDRYPITTSSQIKYQVIRLER